MSIEYKITISGDQCAILKMDDAMIAIGFERPPTPDDVLMTFTYLLCDMYDIHPTQIRKFYIGIRGAVDIMPRNFYNSPEFVDMEERIRFKHHGRLRLSDQADMDNASNEELLEEIIWMMQKSD